MYNNNNNKMSLFTSALTHYSNNIIIALQTFKSSHLWKKRWYVALPCTNACFSKQGGSCFLCFVLSINCNVDCMSRTLRIGWNACWSESIVKKVYIRMLFNDSVPHDYMQCSPSSPPWPRALNVPHDHYTLVQAFGPLKKEVVVFHYSSLSSSYSSRWWM